MEESTRTDNNTNETFTDNSAPTGSASTGDASNGSAPAGNASNGNASTFNQRPIRRLYRTEGPISGVSGGIADYFGVDASIVRLVIAAASVITFPAVPLIYVAAWLIIPEANPAPTEPIMPPAPVPPAPTGNPVPPAPAPDHTGAVDTPVATAVDA